MKHLKILVDGDVAFDGDLDKGCGNHVFDYGKMVHLGGKSDVGSESPRSDLANTSNKNLKTDPSNSDWLCLHDLDKAIIQDKMSAGSQVGESDNSKKSQKISGYCCSNVNIMNYTYFVGLMDKLMVLKIIIVNCGLCVLSYFCRIRR